ncbi:MAG: hypothetical protein ABJB16_07460 [Saprospiraceae bacterium]
MMKYFLRILILTIFIINVASLTPITASPERRDNSIDVLRKEVTKLVQNNAVLLPDMVDQVVTVGFLINARNELIILDVNGDSASVCAYVKQILNYSKVKYNQMRQLTRYSIKIHLVDRK